MIRLANINDISKLDKLLYQVHKVHSDVRPDLFKAGEKKYNDEELKAIINDRSKPIFVYDEDDKILGYAFCVVSEHHEKSLINYKNLYIDDLCVDENTRGKKIGQKLYEYVLEYAKTIGCYNVTLNVWADNKNALEFYKHIGMNVQKIGMETILK